jgi:hypothetical protein
MLSWGLTWVTYHDTVNSGFLLIKKEKKKKKEKEENSVKLRRLSLSNYFGNRCSENN